ncbi:MAG: hypothetical protein MI700_14415, partial [Balneolales bacterium]|nr:hypothetical protein [Balneolales bacterium]
GLEAVRRQEEYIENYLGRGNTFLPDDGFPGPVEIKLMDEDDDPRLNDDIRFVALDTQWWLHPHEKPYGDNGDFEVTDAGDVLTELQDIIRNRKNDYLIIGAHHPLVSNDTHGGYFPLKTHLSPPVFGSLYAFYRKVFGYKQDLTHHRYSEMATAIQETFKEKEEIIYVSGHAHSLQYHEEIYANRYFSHYIVSGSGSKESFVAKGRGADFTHGGKGFITLQIYADGSVWMEAWEPSATSENGNLLYRTKIQDASSNPLDQDFEDIEDIDYADETITTAPNAGYDRGGTVYRAIAGKNRREMWSVESEFPVFDVTEVEGGLTPVRSGGRGQSNTLHLDGDDDKEFVLRSVDKQAGKVWSEGLRQSIALDVAQDQFSMLDPYAPLLVPTLAEAIGVYYMEPTYYVIPDDPKLGSYGDLMAGKLALFERKPDNDMSDVDAVENADEVIGHLDFIREIDGDIDHRVDQELMARSRLFDMLIGDWDRHEDQWRWAAVEPEDEQGKIYKPIPRDRDVAFMRLNGVVPTLLKLGPFMQYQNFEEDYGNLKGLNYNSLGLTRRFTNQLTTHEWVEIAEDIQTKLTDEIISEAVQAYPDPVETQFAQQTAEVLIARRDQLADVTRRYVGLLNKVVSIPGSHKREKVFIEVLSADTIRVQVHKLSGGGEVREKYFDRTFSRKETRELRIYGMGDDDIFEVSGDSKNKIKVRIIGGSGDDTLTDLNPLVKRNFILYDTEEGNDYSGESRIRFELKNSPEINSYNYDNEYMWNSTLLGFYFAFNDDDGLFIGGGPRFTQNSFR